MLALASAARNESSETGNILSERMPHGKPTIIAYISAFVVGIVLIWASLFGMDVSETEVNEREVIASHKIAAFEQEANPRLDVDSWDFVIHSTTDVSVNGDDVYVVMIDPDDTGSYVRKEYQVDDVRIAFDAAVDTARVETVRTTTMTYDGTFLWFDIYGDKHSDETVIHIPDGTIETLSENAVNSGSEAD